MILGLTVTQLNTLADDVIAKIFSGSDTKGMSFTFLGHIVRYPVWAGAVSSLFYAQRLYQFPLGVLGISLATALFPVMSTNAAQGQKTVLARTVSRGISHAVSVAIPATVGLFLIGRPLVSAIFEQGRFTFEDSPIVAHALFFYAIGLSGYFIQQIVTRAFYSLQDSQVPFRSALIAVFTNIILNLILIWFLGTAGLALGTALCSYLQCIILIRALRRRLGTSVLQDVRKTLWGTVAATAVMGFVTWLAMQGMSGWPMTRVYQVGRLAVGVPVAAGVYLVTAKILGLGVMDLFWGRYKDTD
jgi:putative peptidoglycan lipid II flippase